MGSRSLGHVRRALRERDCMWPSVLKVWEDLEKVRQRPEYAELLRETRWG